MKQLFRQIVLIFMVSFMLVPINAFASESESKNVVSFLLEVGVSDVYDLTDPEWLGPKIYFGPGALIKLHHRYALIPIVSLEVAPETGVWGLSGTVMFQYEVIKDHFALDIVPTLFQETRAGHTEFEFGAGPGVTFFMHGHKEISFAVQTVRSLSEDHWTLQPTMNFGVPIP